jgi:hypothetical protein
MQRYNYLKNNDPYFPPERQTLYVENRRANVPEYATAARRFLSEVHTTIQYADTLRAEPLRGPVESAMSNLRECIEEIKALQWEKAQEAGFP